MAVRYATADDIEKMLKLDDKYFPEEWQVEASFTEAVMAKNPFCYRVIESDGLVKGYHLIVPMEKPAFDALLAGEIAEEEVVQHVQSYQTDGDLCLYMGSMVIDMEDSKSFTYFRQAIADFLSQLHHYHEKSPSIQEIGAIAVTKEGRTLCEKLGFGLFDQHYGSAIYKAASKEILIKNTRYFKGKRRKEMKDSGDPIHCTHRWDRK